MPWTSLSSELGYLKILHGPRFLLHLNLASCAPCLPTLILQLIFDQSINRRFGTAKATLVRQFSALLIGTSCLASLPFLPWDQCAPSRRMLRDQPPRRARVTVRCTSSMAPVVLCRQPTDALGMPHAPRVRTAQSNDTFPTTGNVLKPHLRLN